MQRHRFCAVTLALEVRDLGGAGCGQRDVHFEPLRVQGMQFDVGHCTV